jgi:hypothetical protein
VIYRSNLKAPNVAQHFRMISGPMPHSLGHDIPSDPDFDPRCGFMSHDEAAILYNCAKQVGGRWIDIGSRFGWTTAHLIEAKCQVWAVDREYCNPQFKDRAIENLSHWPRSSYVLVDVTAQDFLSGGTGGIEGFVIDGDHDDPQPLLDAKGCLRLANPNPAAVFVFHDFYGKPIRDGVNFLIDQGLKCRIYDTPNGMAVCWRGEFTPPHHVPDPKIDWAGVRLSRCPDFDFAKD